MRYVILILMLFSCSLFAGEVELPGKLDETFLGLRMGCSPAELKVVLEKGKHPCKFIKKTPEGDMIAYLFTGSHQLSGASRTIAMFWNDRLIMLFVRFESDDSEKIYDALKNLIEKKYGAPNDKIQFGGKKCEVSKNGLVIVLEHNVGVMETDTVDLAAGHRALVDARKEQNIKDQEKELGDL